MKLPITEDSLDNEPKKFNELRIWAEQNGAYIHPNIRFICSSSTGFTAYSTKLISKGTRMVCCPSNAAITVEKARSHLFERYESEKADGLDSNILIALYLIWGKQKGRTSSDYGYIASLPDEYDTPLYYSEDILKMINMHPIHRMVMSRLSQWQADYENAVKLRPKCMDMFTWKEYKWAMTTITSRSFPSRLLDEDTRKESRPALIPLLDAFDHKPRTRVTWETISNRGVNLISEEDQVGILYNNYGPKPNLELLLGYGFTFQDNEFDFIPVHVRRPYADKILQIVLDTCGDKSEIKSLIRYDGSFIILSWNLSKSNMFSEPWLRVCRSLFLSPSEEKWIENHPEEVDWNFISFANEYRINSHLENILHDHLECNEDCYNQIQNINATKRKVYLEYYLLGQVDVARHGLHLIQSRLRIVGQQAKCIFMSENSWTSFPFILKSDSVLSSVPKGYEEDLEEVPDKDIDEHMDWIFSWTSLHSNTWFSLNVDPIERDSQPFFKAMLLWAVFKAKEADFSGPKDQRRRIESFMYFLKAQKFEYIEEDHFEARQLLEEISTISSEKVALLSLVDSKVLSHDTLLWVVRVFKELHCPRIDEEMGLSMI